VITGSETYAISAAPGGFVTISWTSQ
jgi:hypothetical protein